jgi:hypothetical protein
VRSGIKAGRVGVDSDEFADARRGHMFQCSLQLCGTRCCDPPSHKDPCSCSARLIRGETGAGF